MSQSNSTHFKLISGPGSAWWPLAPCISQDSVEHPPRSLGTLVSLQHCQSVQQEGGRAEAACLENASGRLVSTFLPDNIASAVRDNLPQPVPIRTARFSGLKGCQNGVFVLAWIQAIVL